MLNDEVRTSSSERSPASILDDEMIAQLRDLGMLEEIGRCFLDEGPKFIAELGAAIHRHDAPALHRTAHTLKGASAAMGARRIKTGSLQLEQMGRSGTLEGADELLTQMEHDFKELAYALENAWTSSTRAGGTQ